ncbi:MAG: hypothetical protein JO357_05485 [Hyphomicrobiales bacterium]|nr:hypothetical protein [Hyphomicrobiales bacterium]MBV9754328.1 hypothetical protein [Hyphomicrobiales bacterium]
MNELTRAEKPYLLGWKLQRMFGAEKSSGVAAGFCHRIAEAAAFGTRIIEVSK